MKVTWRLLIPLSAGIAALTSGLILSNIEPSTMGWLGVLALFLIYAFRSRRLDSTVDFFSIFVLILRYGALYALGGAIAGPGLNLVAHYGLNLPLHHGLGFAIPIAAMVVAGATGCLAGAMRILKQRLTVRFIAATVTLLGLGLAIGFWIGSALVFGVLHVTPLFLAISPIVGACAALSLYILRLSVRRAKDGGARESLPNQAL